MILRGEVRVKTVVRTEKQTFDSFDVRQRFAQRFTSVSIYSSLRVLIYTIVFLEFLRVTEYSAKISRARNFIPTSARLSAQKCG